MGEVGWVVFLWKFGCFFDVILGIYGYEGLVKVVLLFGFFNEDRYLDFFKNLFYKYWKLI